MFELRDYQHRVVLAIFDWWAKHATGNCIAEMCTAAGKSWVIAGLIRHCYQLFPNHAPRVLVLAPSTELIEQNLEKLLLVWPESPIGVLSAGLGRKDYLSQILYGTIGTVYRAMLDIGAFDLVIIDECHGVGPSDAGMYRKLIATLRGWNPNVRFVGLTATPFRGDGVWLTAIENPLFHGIAAKVTIGELLPQGFLSPLITPKMEQLIDAAKVAMSAGDYKINELAAATDQAAITERAIEMAVMQGTGRKAWIAFCVTVEHAEHVCDALMRRGIVAAVVSGKTPTAERKYLIQSFKAGRIRCLVTVAALLVGFDAPAIDMVIYLRPTRSPVLYVQSIGRALRPAPGKTDALILDFTDTIERLGPVDKIAGREARTKGKTDAPFKVCPTCAVKLATAVLVCPDCNHQFPAAERITHGVLASGAVVLAAGQLPSRYDVTRVAYGRHIKPGSPDSMRVDYYSGIRRVFSEWVCVEHAGYAKAKADAWWRRRSLDNPPASVYDALFAADGLTVPAAITINESGKFPELVGVTWHEAHV